jgi:hypothetical protein
MRAFGRDAAEIVPHAGDHARDLDLRKFGKGAADVAPSMSGDAQKRADAAGQCTAEGGSAIEGQSLNPPNRDAAPQASRRWANRGVLAERLGAGVLAVEINCENQVGIRFRRRRLAGRHVHRRHALLPPDPRRGYEAVIAAKIVGVASSAQQRSGRLRRLLHAANRGSARKLQNDGWHIDPLHFSELIFSDHALVTVSLALNAVLENVSCFGEQANDFEEPPFCVFLTWIRRKPNCLANRKFMGGHRISA